MTSNVIANIASDGFAITPSDTVRFTKPCGGIMVGGGGTISFVTAAGTVIATEVVTGQIIPMDIQRVNATGTGATLLIGLIP